jgi:uncharacterized protein (DUF2336 family)
MSGFFKKTVSWLTRRGVRPSGLPKNRAAPGPRPVSSGANHDFAQLALDPDPGVRRSLAARTDMRPELLYFLSQDAEAEVRRAVATNPTTPFPAVSRLASDGDHGVRENIAERIARLAPGLEADEQDRLRRMTYDALMLLAVDQTVRVRQILAETLKSVANAPPALIRQLAYDTEIAVAGPIIEFSPVLSDEDLLEIIHGAPAVGALSAIARRRSLNESVADAVAASGDDQAVAALLGNGQAQIREETLDRLIDQAPMHELWHMPLVKRPYLSGRAAIRLSRFVAEQLLVLLLARTDLDAATKAQVAAVVRQRVESQGAEMAPVQRGGKAPAPAPAETPRQRVERLISEGKLEEPTIIEALDAHDEEFVIHALANMADIPVDRVRRVLAANSGKGVVALSWRAGLGMSTALLLQTRLAKLPPSAVVRAPKGSASYPMTAAQMTWQLAYLAGSGSEHGRPVNK